MVGVALQTYSKSSIIPAISLPRFKREFFRLPFAYSLYGVLFHTISKLATDLLANFQAKNLFFQSQFSQCYHFTCGYITHYIKGSWPYSMVLIDLDYLSQK